MPLAVWGEGGGGYFQFHRNKLAGFLHHQINLRACRRPPKINLRFFSPMGQRASNLFDDSRSLPRARSGVRRGYRLFGLFANSSTLIPGKRFVMK